MQYYSGHVYAIYPLWLLIHVKELNNRVKWILYTLSVLDACFLKREYVQFIKKMISVFLVLANGSSPCIRYALDNDNVFYL